MQHNKSNILYLRTDLGTQDLIGGGSVTHTLGVINGLLEQGHTVNCFSSAMHNLLKEIDHEQFSCVPLLMPRILKVLGFKINCLLSNLFFYRTIEQQIKINKPDLLYQRYSMLNMVGVWLKQQYKIPLILEFNGSETWVDANWSSGKLRMRALIDKIEIYNLQHADSIVVVSQVLKEQLIARGITASKILVNPNGVDLERFNAARLIDARTAKRDELGLADRYVIGFSGTFAQWHGVDALSYVIARVLAKHKRVHFLLMGDGPLKKQLEADLFDYIGNGVTFTNMLAVDQMPAYLAACDAFLCPTQPNKDGTPFFGSPTKLFEYMAMGKPIIASRIGQVAELIEHNELLVDPHDYEGFVHAIGKLLHNHHQRCDLLGKDLQCKVQNYSWSAHVDRIIKASNAL